MLPELASKNNTAGLQLLIVSNTILHALYLIATLSLARFLNALLRWSFALLYIILFCKSCHTFSCSSLQWCWFSVQLPNCWLWDMIDEFIYQFQSFQQYRGRLSNKSQDELNLLRKCDNIWNTSSVLNYLQALIDKSKIVSELIEAGMPYISRHVAVATLISSLACLAKLAIGAPTKRCLLPFAIEYFDSLTCQFSTHTMEYKGEMQVFLCCFWAVLHSSKTHLCKECSNIEHLPNQTIDHMSLALTKEILRITVFRRRREVLRHRGLWFAHFKCAEGSGIFQPDRA